MQLGDQGGYLLRRTEVAPEENDPTDVQPLDCPPRRRIQRRAGNADHEELPDPLMHQPPPDPVLRKEEENLQTQLAAG